MADKFQLKALITGVDKLSPVLKGLQAKVKSWRREMRAAGEGAAPIGAGLVASVALPIKAAMDFESAMAEVRKVVDFKSPDGLQKMADNIRQMSKEIPLAASDLAKIAASGGQLGVAEADLPAFTRTIAKMATAFDMGAEEAGDSMAKLANVYKIPIGEIGRLGDAVNYLSDKTPAKAREVVDALSRVGGVSKQFGLTEVQTAALANSFISLGKTPEIAGTAINGMLMKLGTADKQGGKFQDGLKAIGLSASGLKKSIGKDAQGALNDFLGRVSKLDKSKQMGVLVDMFGLEYADDVAVLVGSLNTYADAQKYVGEQTQYAGSMQREFDNRAKTTANNLQLFKNRVTDIGITVGDTLLPPLNEFLDTVKPMIDRIGAFAKAHPEVIKGLIGMAAGLVAFKVAALAGSAVLPKLSTAMDLFNGAIKMSPMGKFLLIAELLAMAAGLIIANWSTIGPKVAEIWDGIMFTVGAGIEFLKAAFLNFTPLGLIIKNWEPLVAWFKGFAARLAPIIDPIINGAKWVGEKVGGLLGGGGEKSGAPAPKPAPINARAPQTAQVGGTVHIKLDQDGRARVQQIKSDNPRVGINVDAGLMTVGR